MERRLKERLIGAAVLVLLAVIFIPMLLNDTTQYNSEITRSNIPAKPGNKFSSRIIPIEDIQSVEEPLKKTVPTPQQEETIPVQSPEPGIQRSDESTSATEETVTPETIIEDVQTHVTPLNAQEVGVRAWIVQLGSFTSETNAQNLNDSLRKQGFTSFVEPLHQQSRVIYRVRVGPELLRSDAETIRDKIRESNQMEGIVIPYP